MPGYGMIPVEGGEELQIPLCSYYLEGIVHQKLDSLEEQLHFTGFSAIKRDALCILSHTHQSISAD